MAIAGLVGSVFRQTTDPSVPFTDQATTAITATGLTPYTRYQITDTTKRYWDPTATVTVKKNGTVVTSGYTIEYLSGFVVFAVALLNTDTVTVSASAMTVQAVGGVFQWKLDINMDMEDVTTFGNGTGPVWKQFQATLAGFSGSAESYWTDEGEEGFLTGGNDVILVLYADAGANKARYEGFARFKKISIDSSVKAVVKKTVDFEGDGQVFYRAG